MSKIISVMKRSLIFLHSALLLSLTSCVNEEYDLNKIEVGDIGLLEGAVAPLGSTDKIMISNIVDLDQAEDFLKTDEQGNFYLLMSDEDLLSETVEIPDFKFDGYDDENPHDFTIDSPIAIPASLDPSFETPVIEFTDVEYDIEIDQRNIPDLVKGIEYADVTSDLIVKFEYDQSSLPFTQVMISKGTKITFPEWVVLGQLPAGCKRISDYELELDSDLAIRPSGSEIDFPLDAVDFTKLPDGQGIIGESHLYLDAVVSLTGGIYLRAADCQAAGSYKPVITTYLHMDPMTIEYARLTGVNLGDKAHFSHDMNLKDQLPEFLRNDNINFDFNDLSLRMWYVNSLPFSGNVNANVKTFDNSGAEPLHQYDVTSAFQVSTKEGNVIEHIYTDSGADGTEKLEGLNSIMNPVPEYLSVSADIVVDDIATQKNPDPAFGVIAPGDEYHISCGYSLKAPLSFGKNLSIDFSQDITGLGLAINDVEVPEAQLKLNLVNALPLDFELSAQALDEDGNVLPSINLEIEGAIKGGTLESPAVNPLVLNITCEGELKLDGIRLSLAAKAASDNAVLNKNQYMQLTDMALTLPAGLTVSVE